MDKEIGLGGEFPASTERQQIVVTGAITAVENAADAAFLWQEIERLGATFRRMKEELSKELIDWMKRENIQSFQIDADNKVVLGKKSYDRFEANAIFDALGFTEEQRAVLAGGNSAFRKGGVLENEKTAIAYSEEEKDVVELKPIDMKRVKEAKIRKDLAAKATKAAA